LDDSIATDFEDNESDLIPKPGDTSRKPTAKEILSDNLEFMPIAKEMEKVLANVISTVFKISAI
jgi:hypothetical protein